MRRGDDDDCRNNCTQLHGSNTVKREFSTAATIPTQTQRWLRSECADDDDCNNRNNGGDTLHVEVSSGISLAVATAATNGGTASVAVATRGNAVATYAGGVRTDVADALTIGHCSGAKR